MDYGSRNVVNPIPLLHPLHLKPGFEFERLETVRQAILFLNALAADRKQEWHWLLVEKAFAELDRNPTNRTLVNTATLHLETAFRIEHMLQL